MKTKGKIMTLKGITDQSIENQTLLVNLRETGIESKIKNEYAILNQFRNETKVDVVHKPYEHMLKHALIYRSIFIGLGSLFFFLGLYISEQSINWFSYTLLFAHSLNAKNIVFAICLILSIAAFGLNFIVSAEREALRQLIKRTKRKLERIYNKQNLLLELSGNPSDLKRSKKLKKVYEDTLHKLEELEDSSKILFSQIARSNTKECSFKLFNQALLEVNDDLHIVVNKFKKMTLFF